MRKIGEKTLSSVPTSKKPDRRYKNIIKKRNIDVACVECGYTAKFSEAGLRNLNGRDWVCNECKKKGQKELHQAMINLAKNKKLKK